MFAIQVLPHRYPDLLNEDTDENVMNSFVLPDDAIRDVPKAAK